MDFEKICMMFSMQEPYYGILLSSMKRRAVPGMGTLGVMMSGGVCELGYDPAFMDAQPIETQLELCKHEVLHYAFGHFTLWENNNVDQAEHQLRNVAEDLEVNCYLDKSKLAKLGPCLAENFGFDPNLGAREYYRLLVKMAQQQQQQSNVNNPKKPCNGGMGGMAVQSNRNSRGAQGAQPSNNQQPSNSQSQSQSQSNNNGAQSKPDPSQNGTSSPSSGTPTAPEHDPNFLDQFNVVDDHSKWPDMDENEQEQMKQMVESLLEFAAEEVEKSCGSIPGEMVGRIKAIRNRKRPKPVADWRKYMRRYIGNEFSEEIRKSKKRESRRFPDAPGNRHRRKSHVLVAIDTSGSVSMPEYLEFFGQIATLKEKATFHVVECDTEIQHEYEFNGKPAQILHGGGGTSFQPPIDLFNKEKRKYDALIYFTDGYAPIPKDTPKETLWVISSNGDKNRAKYKINGAKSVFIPEKNN